MPNKAIMNTAHDDCGGIDLPTHACNVAADFVKAQDAEIASLRAERDALQEGLAFYADKANYVRFYNPEGLGPSSREPVLADFGKTARALLDTTKDSGL